MESIEYNSAKVASGKKLPSMITSLAAQRQVVFLSFLEHQETNCGCFSLKRPTQSYMVIISL